MSLISDLGIRRAAVACSWMVCVLVFAMMGLSHAAPQPSAPADGDGALEHRELHRAGELRGMAVKNMQNERLGTIRDAAVNLEDGAVIYLAMAAGGFLGVGERLHALPPHVLFAGADRRVLILDAAVEELRADSGFDRNEWPEMAHLWREEITEPAGAERTEDDEPDRVRGGNWLRGDRPRDDARVEDRRVTRAGDVIGAAVRNRENESLGNVKDLAIDLRSGRIVYVVLAHGGFLGIGEKFFAIPPDAFQWAPNGRRALLLEVSAERLSQARGFDPQRWPVTPDDTWHFEPYEFHGQERPAVEEPAGAAPVEAKPLSDREITQRIRRAVVTDEALSFSAKNIAIQISDGVVTLRGIVRSEEEREAILEKAKEVPGVEQVHDELEVRPRQD